MAHTKPLIAGSVSYIYFLLKDKIQHTVIIYFNLWPMQNILMTHKLKTNAPYYATLRLLGRTHKAHLPTAQTSSHTNLVLLI